MTKVILSGHILVSRPDLETVLHALETHKALTLAEEGCLIFEVTQCDIEPCRFNVYEEFIDMAAFECHQRRVKDSYWGQVTQNVERHYTLME